MQKCQIPSLEDQALFKEIYCSFRPNTEEFSSYLSVSSCFTSSVQSLDHHSHQYEQRGLHMQGFKHEQLQTCIRGSAKANKHGTHEHKMRKSTCKLNHACFTELGLEKQALGLATCKTGGCPWQWKMILFVAKKCSLRENWCLNCTCYTYPTCADTGKLSSLPLVLLPPFS